ncbi:MAG: diacylglycerol kinase [Burkholderiaceae bacterium]
MTEQQNTESGQAQNNAAAHYKSQPGLRRLGPALRYSWQGLRATWRTESAFRQELAIGLPLMILAWVIEPDRWRALLLSAVIVLVWVVELLNTSLESLCDRITTERDPAIKAAKDAGSAAVFLSLLIAIACWGLWIFERFRDALT